MCHTRWHNCTLTISMEPTLLLEKVSIRDLLSRFKALSSDNILSYVMGNSLYSRTWETGYSNAKQCCSAGARVSRAGRRLGARRNQYGDELLHVLNACVVKLVSK